MEWRPNFKRVWAVYFSATGSTKKVVTSVADALSRSLSLGDSISSFDFTTPSAREGAPEFSENDIVVFGLPVYAGRLPNLMLKYIKAINGNGALAVPVVLFGNRGFDDALIELRDVLEAGGFHPIAAAAFVGEHSFSSLIAAGRPNEDDLKFAQDFGFRVAEKVGARGANTIDGSCLKPIEVPGVPLPYRGYYQPKNVLGGSIDIRKVKPETKEECNRCGICIGLCPMGAIDVGNPNSVSGICIKCCACVKYCPKDAKYFIDSGYLYHVGDLEEELSAITSSNEVFL